MTHRKSPLSEKVLRERLSVHNDRMDAVELDFEALLSTLHPSQRRNGANRLPYVALRSESILELQDAVHEFGLSSLASSESHVRHQLSAARSRLGEVMESRADLFTLPEACALMHERTQAHIGRMDGSVSTKGTYGPSSRQTPHSRTGKSPLAAWSAGLSGNCGSATTRSLTTDSSRAWS